tara:strand:+ start:160 stop:306 length:147 start_codon:yes stop_codon:yes gene_type:complete
VIRALVVSVVVRQLSREITGEAIAITDHDAAAEAQTKVIRGRLYRKPL